MSRPDPAPGEARRQHTDLAVLEQALWRDLVEARSDESFGEAWLGLAFRAVPGAVAGILIMEVPPAVGEAAQVAAWPADALPDPALPALARRALAEGRGVLEAAEPAAASALRLAYPVLLEGRAVGAAALVLARGTAAEPRRAMRELQWAIGWVRDHARRRAAAAGGARAGRSAIALDLVAAGLEQERFANAARAAVTEMAVRLGCERVSLGLTRRRITRVVAISHTAQFGRRMNLIRQLGDAMDEALDQSAAILFPPTPDEPLATRAHAALAEAHGAGHILTIPLLVRDRHVGALLLERPAGAPFDQATVDLADAAGALLAPALLDKRANDRWLAVVAWDALSAQAMRLLGPGHPGRKLALACLVVLGLCAEFATGTYRVTAEGQLEGTMRRALGAPFDGYIAEVQAKAGDMVRAGDSLAVMDRRDLTLERLRWTTERQQHATEYDRALAARQRTEALRARNLIDQAEAQIRLVDEQLARASILAPFDGLVVSGELTQQVGAPVRRGDLLFELAPLDFYRVELRVHESQIAEVTPGQRGMLAVAALPGQSFAFTVERVTPVATAHEGRTYFAVDGRLDEAGDRLRPGMRGVGKIEIREERLVWIWLRPLVQWAQVALWRWLP